MNKEVYYDIYNEFYDINKFRELKTIINHGQNRLDHINRVAKISFIISKKLGLDYVSCTRGAILHDFFTKDDLNNYNLDSKKNVFNINEIEYDIILTHIYPITKKRPIYIETKIVCIVDKLVGIYEFFRYKIRFSI